MTEPFDAVLAEGRNVIRDQCGDGLERTAFTDLLDRLAAAHAAEVEALKESLDGKRHEAKSAWVAAEAADIDALMLEYCPEGMTPEQVAEWKGAIATTEQADD